MKNHENAIGNRVTEAFGHMVAGDAREALFDICAAAERTARQEGYSRNRTGFKAFVIDNIPIIAAIGIGPALAGLRFQFSHPDIPASSDGTCGIEDIIYHLARCGLYHDASMTNAIRFSEKTIGPDGSGNLQLPRMLVTGLIVAVVASPASSDQITDDQHWFSCNGQVFYLNKLWGKRDDLLNQLKGLWPASGP